MKYSAKKEREDLGIDIKTQIREVEKRLLETRQTLQSFMDCMNPELSSFQNMETELDVIKEVVEEGSELEEDLEDLEKEQALERADEIE